MTVCLTSCNRLHLLQRTLNSFTTLNTYPIEEFIITEDSANPEMWAALKQDYEGTIPYFTEKRLALMAKPFKLVLNPTKLGQFKSADNMYQAATTNYIFHCEDDWLFDGNNSNFIKDSIDILEENEHIHQVGMRTDISSSWMEDEILVTKTGVQYRMMKLNHCGDWCGFSQNPNLRRKSDYLKMFPGGYSVFDNPSGRAADMEHILMLHAKAQGYRAANLVHSVIRHIGEGCSTYVR